MIWWQHRDIVTISCYGDNIMIPRKYHDMVTISWYDDNILIWWQYHFLVWHWSNTSDTTFFDEQQEWKLVTSQMARSGPGSILKMYLPRVPGWMRNWIVFEERKRLKKTYGKKDLKPVFWECTWLSQCLHLLSQMCHSWRGNMKEIYPKR